MKIKIGGEFEGTPFARDCLNEENNNVNQGMWNLILSIRDFRLYAGGMKPHGGWSPKVTKEYFGISGNAEKCYNLLKHLKSEIDNAVDIQKKAIKHKKESEANNEVND